MDIFTQVPLTVTLQHFLEALIALGPIALFAIAALLTLTIGGRK